MGCVYNFIRLADPGTDDKKALALADEVMAQARYAYGHAGYTGSFAEARGATVVSYRAKDATDADQWLDQNTEKWGPALLIRDDDGAWYMGAQCSS